MLSSNPEDYRVITSGIEDVTIRKNHYDLCLTSPPFFDIETYEIDNREQSIKKHPKSKQWQKHFLIPLANTNIKGLRKDGCFVIYIPKYEYFMQYLHNHQQLRYVGELIFSTPKKRLLYVWKKK